MPGAARSLAVIADDLDTLDAQQLRQALRASRAELAFKQAVIDKLTHEMATLRRLKFAARSEAYNAEQQSLLQEALDSDLAAVAAEIEAMQPARGAGDRRTPRREKLPAHLPRREIHHEPSDTHCGCGQPMQRIGEDVAEKLDYQPGVFTVERHIRGKWVDLHYLAHAPHAVFMLVALDERVPHPDCLAKYAAAFFRMSRSSVTRLSSAFRRRSSSVWDVCNCRSGAGTA